MSDPKATVRVVNGQVVLDDPDALAVIHEVGKHNCYKTAQRNFDRVKHFKQRMQELGKSTSEVVIVILNVDDVHGGPIADILMPGTNWQEIRNRGEVPYARGLAGREGIQETLELFDAEAAIKLHDLNGLAVVVVDYGIAEIFTA